MSIFWSLYVDNPEVESSFRAYAIEQGYKEKESQGNSIWQIMIGEHNIQINAMRISQRTKEVVSEALGFEPSSLVDIRFSSNINYADSYRLVLKMINDSIINIESNVCVLFNGEAPILRKNRESNKTFAVDFHDFWDKIPKSLIGENK